MSLIALAAVWISGPGASAGIILDILSTSISAGGTGAVDVFITATSATDNLAAYGIDFNILPTGATTTELNYQYIAGHQTLLLNDANYVYGAGGGTSDGSNVGTIGPLTTYSAIDFSLDPNGVTGPFTSRLLAHLDLTTLTGSPPQAGDTFMITADPLSPSFFDMNGDPVSFTINPGTITINGAAAVPEPSSLIILASGAGWFGVRRIRRRGRSRALAQISKQ